MTARTGPRTSARDRRRLVLGARRPHAGGGGRAARQTGRQRPHRQRRQGASRPAGRPCARHPAPAHRRTRAGQVAYTAESVRRLARVPGAIGLKDGHSDLDRLQRTVLAAPEDFLFFNGAATAEVQARAYAAVGVPAYSSAVHAFAPEIANAFLAALHGGDTGTVDKLLRGFYVPLVELRDRVPGYAVSLVKAAARLRGCPVGPVRAPLTDPSPADLAELKTLLTTGLDLVGAAL
ncbi:5-dehydro-4-deoxyglucarate dehydratase [Streptomyces tendae]